MMTLGDYKIPFTTCACALILTGCLGRMASHLADREVYPIIAEGQTEALGRSRDFTIEVEADPLTNRVLTTAAEATDEFTTEGLRISLADSLGLALRNSRTYQTRKEDLYRTALALTEERHAFSPIFSGTIRGTFDRSPVINAAENDVVDVTREGTLTTNIGVSQRIMWTGGRITVGLANNFTRFYSADPQEWSTGVLTASIVQPLLRGAGMKVAVENLRQAERNVIYQVRDFSRFEKGFIVDRIEQYYRVLQSLDSVRNERRSYDNLILNRERSEALADAGRLQILQLDQSRQQELSARNRWLSAQTSFMQSLDRFKIDLGLPTDLAILPDEAELNALVEGGLPPVEYGSLEAVDIALADRLDYITSAQEVEDAERRVDIAWNGLLPELNIEVASRTPDDNKSQPLSISGRRRDYTVSGALELPLDRKSERNDYRDAMIRLERAKRERQGSRDAIIREVRSAYQDLELAARSYEIQLRSLEVAERRVDSTTMLFQSNRAIVRDVLESESDLLDARNARTRALIDHAVARLRFLVAIERLEIDDQGMWFEGETTTEGSDTADAR